VNLLPELEVKCKTCGIWFKSGIAADEKSFETLILKRNFHRCPRGHTHAYDKEDYRLKPS
jgi:hypothetical protein